MLSQTVFCYTFALILTLNKIAFLRDFFVSSESGESGESGESAELAESIVINSQKPQG